ncbi:uncharacterized protein BDV14DRAFT_202760 [Aspergillus stella-maris]|uniref:uncharacterized protein n=1 Tax=Aspergillus stella-maris TaxID=1810926 RepID=UPI003CCC9215
MFCCPKCAKAHPESDVELPPRFDYQHVLKCHDITTPDPWTKREISPLQAFFDPTKLERSRYNFYFVHALLVMKSYYSGSRRGITPESLAWLEISGKARTIHHITTLLSVEARVCTRKNTPPSLVLQVQQWRLFPKITRASDILWHLRDETLKRLPFALCGHSIPDLGQFPEDSDGAWPSLALSPGSQPTPATTNSGTKYNHPFTCIICGVDDQYILRDCGEDGKALIVTKYLNLGAGLDINDPNWQRLTREVVRADRRVYAAPACGREYPGFDEGAITKRNWLYLRGEKYRKIMRGFMDSYTPSESIFQGLHDRSIVSEGRKFEVDVGR